MVQKIFIFLFFTISSTTYAGVNNLLSCVVNTIESRKINHDSAKSLIQILGQIHNDEAHRSLLEMCKKIKKESKDLTELSRKEARLIITAAGAEFPDLKSETNIAIKLNENEINCYTVGAEANAYMSIGGGVGINIGYCSSLSGRRYGIVAPELNYGYGIGAFVLLSGNHFSYNLGESINPYIENEVLMGYIVALGADENETTLSFGIGIGGALQQSNCYPIKLLVLPRNYKELKKQLKLKTN